jgi:hypothetical protein
MTNKLLSMFKKQMNMERIILIYLGFFLLSNVAVGWLIPLENLKLPPDAESFILKLWEINILMPTVKLIELISAILFLINRKTFLGLLLFYPVLFNIILINIHFFGSISYTAMMLVGIFYLTWQKRHMFFEIVR